METGMISICIITKNESERIGKCLERLVPLGYEIVVADTGSTDDTKQIALKFTDKVYDFEWVDNFSAARNFCASKATSNFIFVLDSDEYLLEFNKKWVESNLKKYPNNIGEIQINNLVGTTDVNALTNVDTSYVPRIYNKKLYHFDGIVHEQIESISNIKKLPIEAFPVTVEHVGYIQTLEQKKIKAQRNIALLEKQLRTGKDKEYTMYQIGNTYVYEKDYIRGYAYLKATLDFDLDPKKDWVLDLMITYMIVLQELKLYDEALQIIGVYDAFDYSSDFLYEMGQIYRLTNNPDQAIEEYKKATKIKTSLVDGKNSYMSYYSIGAIYYEKGDMENAKLYFKKALPFEMAKDSLEIIKNQEN